MLVSSFVYEFHLLRGFIYFKVVFRIGTLWLAKIYLPILWFWFFNIHFSDLKRNNGANVLLINVHIYLFIKIGNKAYYYYGLMVLRHFMNVYNWRRNVPGCCCMREECMCQSKLETGVGHTNLPGCFCDYSPLSPWWTSHMLQALAVTEKIKIPVKGKKVLLDPPSPPHCYGL